jgi:hypothetical protein
MLPNDSLLPVPCSKPAVGLPRPRTGHKTKTSDTRQSLAFRSELDALFALAETVIVACEATLGSSNLVRLQRCSSAAKKFYGLFLLRCYQHPFTFETILKLEWCSARLQNIIRELDRRITTSLAA